ncbi:MAG TPA: nucleic acid-binding protein [Cyanothece sp. UBA12306]|nr:nucleic acid-binding protein [Cyanothece sp. UBA12306]
MKNKLFIDTWGWLTLYDRREVRHQEVSEFYQQFRSQNGIIYTTDYVLDETFTLLFKRIYAAKAQQSMQILINAFQRPNFNLIWINEIRFMKTQALRYKFIDKPQISFTDLTSMVVMKELGISLVLTEDAHFMQVGLEIEKIP